MQVDCPECGASLEGTPGKEMVCPACMNPFLVPVAAPAAVRTFDVSPGGDLVLHDMSRHAIREAIYTGKLTSAARVRHDGGPWELIGGHPEFAAVLRLLGGDLAPMAGTRKLAGWRRTDGPTASSGSWTRPGDTISPFADDPTAKAGDAPSGPRVPRPVSEIPTVPSQPRSGTGPLPRPVPAGPAPRASGPPRALLVVGALAVVGTIAGLLLLT